MLELLVHPIALTNNNIRERPEMPTRYSEDFPKMAPALAKAQASIVAAKKNTTNPFFDSTYSDIAAILDVIRQPAADNGLAYICSAPDPSNKRVVKMTDKKGEEYDEYLCDVTTVLRVIHESGAWFETETTLPAIESSHGIASAGTYGRRYCYTAAFSIATEDDDGNAAKSQGAPAKRREPPQPKTEPKPQQREASDPSEDQLRASVNQSQSASNQPADEDLGRLVAEACKSLGLNKVQHIQMCMDVYGQPWTNMTVGERRDQLAKLSARVLA